MQEELLTEQFQDFLNTLSAYEEELANSIADLAKQKDWIAIEKRTEYAKRVENFQIKAHNFLGELEALLSQDAEQDFDEAEYLSEQSASERTSWEILDDQIRVFTKKGSGSGYSNVLSIDLFSKLAETAFSFIKANGYVKTTEVLNKMASYVRENSDYKKTPRIPVYVTFKVLLKENIFANVEGNSHRYTMAVAETELFRFLKTLRKQ